jgi:hypothetical protein
VLDRREARELLLSADARRDLRRARELLAAAIALAPDWSAPRAALDDAGQWEAMLEVTTLWREAVGSDPRALVEHAAALLRLWRITECVETLDAAERAHGDLRALVDNDAFDRCSDLPALSRWA